MTHNDEKDRYRKNVFSRKLCCHQFSDKIKFKSNIRIAETYNQYDAEKRSSVARQNEVHDVTYL